MPNLATAISVEGRVAAFFPHFGSRILDSGLTDAGHPAYLVIKPSDGGDELIVYGNWRQLTDGLLEPWLPIQAQVEDHPELRGRYQLRKDADGRPQVQMLAVD